MTLCSFSNSRYTIEVNTSGSKFVTALFSKNDGIYQTVESQVFETLDEATGEFHRLFESYFEEEN